MNAWAETEPPGGLPRNIEKIVQNRIAWEREKGRGAKNKMIKSRPERWIIQLYSDDRQRVLAHSGLPSGNAMGTGGT